MIDPRDHVAIAQRVAAQYESAHGLERGECLGDAWLGLLVACEKFDPSRGCSFKTYAASKVWNGIIDAHRIRTKARSVVVDGQRKRTGRVLRRLPDGMRARATPAGHGLDIRERIAAEQRRQERHVEMGHARTSERRREVAWMLARGLTHQQIATSLGVGIHSVTCDASVLRTGMVPTTRSMLKKSA